MAEIHPEASLFAIIFHNNGGIIVEAGLRGIAASQQRLSILQEVACHTLRKRLLFSRKEPIVAPQSKPAFPVIAEEALIICSYRMTATGALANCYPVVPARVLFPLGE